jgi:hypothetical protein
MKLEMKNYKCSQEEFESMSALDKRNYILQLDQEETNWWLRTMSKVYIIGFVLGILAFISVVSSVKYD